MSDEMYKETEAILNKIKEQGWQSDITTLGSAREAPLSKYAAYTFSAYHLALAANQLEDERLLEQAEAILDKAYWAWYTPSLTQAKHSELRDIIRSYRNVLMSHPRASEIELVLLRMWEQSDPDAMNEELVFDSKTEEDTHISDAIAETIKDVGKPLSLAGGLISGKLPTGMDPNTFRLIQVGVYGGLVAGVLGFTYLYIRPFLPQRK